MLIASLWLHDSSCWWTKLRYNIVKNIFTRNNTKYCYVLGCAYVSVAFRLNTIVCPCYEGSTHAWTQALFLPVSPSKPTQRAFHSLITRSPATVHPPLVTRQLNPGPVLGATGFKHNDSALLFWWLPGHTDVFCWVRQECLCAWRAYVCQREWETRQDSFYGVRQP